MLSDLIRYVQLNLKLWKKWNFKSYNFHFSVIIIIGDKNYKLLKIY